MAHVRQFRPVTAELRDSNSLVVKFMKARFPNLRDVQRRYRQDAPGLVVAPVARTEADPGIIGTAADWLMRFLVHPSPDLTLARYGTSSSLEPLDNSVMNLFEEVVRTIGMGREVSSFEGPVVGSTLDAELLARCCWGLAMLTHVFRIGPPALLALAGHNSLESLVPAAGLSQLAALRAVMERELVPRLAARHGMWTLGPTFTGSHFMNGDGDLIASGLLLDLKTTSKTGLDGKDMYQLIAYALMDWDDEYRLEEIAIFAARFGYLATWKIADLFAELSGGLVSLEEARAEFQGLLTGLD